MKEEILEEYIKRVEDSIRYNSDQVSLTIDEQLQILVDCKTLINELKKVGEQMKYYRSEHVNVANYWKSEIESHRKTKNELKNIKLKYKDLYQKYSFLKDSKGGNNNVCV